MSSQSPKFPSPERNALLRRIASDPRSRKRSQERPKAPLAPPTRFRRVASGRATWNLPRRLPDYDVQQDTSIGGQATKWVIRNRNNPEDFFIAKFGNKNGRIEVLTELFNNQLGSRLGFKMAHSGLARLDGHLYFITRNFRVSEDLVHGSLIVESVFGGKDPEKIKDELASIDTREEQSFWQIVFVKDVINEYCEADSEIVFAELLQMLVFDALIGSMDRHPKNWGVLRSQVITEPETRRRFRLAPIFDSARALLWDLPEGKLLELSLDEQELRKYLQSAKPCIGIRRETIKSSSCNHFEFIERLNVLYPHQMREVHESINSVDVVGIAGKLLKEFPFARGFSSLRRRMILKVLRLRVNLLQGIFEKGGAHEHSREAGTIDAFAVCNTTAHGVGLV